MIQQNNTPLSCFRHININMRNLIINHTININLSQPMTNQPITNIQSQQPRPRPRYMTRADYLRQQQKHLDISIVVNIHT